MTSVSVTNHQRGCDGKQPGLGPDKAEGQVEDQESKELGVYVTELTVQSADDEETGELELMVRAVGVIWTNAQARTERSELEVIHTNVPSTPCRRANERVWPLRRSIRQRREYLQE